MSASGPRVRSGGLSGTARLAWSIAALSLGLVAVTVATELAGSTGGPDVEGRDWLLALLCVPLGARVAAHSPRNPCGWLVLAVGLLAAATVATSTMDTPATAWSRDWLWWPSFGLLILVALLFPDGRPLARAWRWVTIGTVAATATGTIGLAHLSLRTPGDLLSGTERIRAGWDTAAILAAYAALLVFAVLAVVGLLVRVRRAPHARRGPLVWAGLNALLLVVASVLDSVGGVPLVWIGTALAIPAAAAIGVVRYGLYDIDLLVHRSMLYGLFVCALIAAYAATVSLSVRLVPAVPAPVTAALVLVALLPLRRSLDALLQRVLYGHSADPYRLATALGRQVGMAGTPDQVLTAAVRVIGEGLKAPFVAVHLGGQSTAQAAYGRRRGWPVTTLPLTYQGAPIGALLIQRRSADEGWSRREQGLLCHLTEQLAPATASVNLTRDLQAARESLVHAREEELRRLQRDLHDGVGPLLSGARMLAKGARDSSGSDTVRSTMDELETTLDDAAAEIRRIVDGLRPPALDRGLATALTGLVRRHRGSGLTVDLTCAGDLENLSAAVEVATYRVVDEALTNVIKHAGASRASVEIHRESNAVRVAIDDDGAGGAGVRPDGVGLTSMRQRCEELGGTLQISDLSPGTRLLGTMPLS